MHNNNECEDLSMMQHKCNDIFNLDDSEKASVCNDHYNDHSDDNESHIKNKELCPATCNACNEPHIACLKSDRMCNQYELEYVNGEVVGSHNGDNTCEDISEWQDICNEFNKYTESMRTMICNKAPVKTLMEVQYDDSYAELAKSVSPESVVKDICPSTCYACEANAQMHAPPQNRAS